MSGESRGLIVLPLLFGGMPLLLGGLAVAGVAYAAVGVARAISGRNQQANRNNHYQQQNQRIQNNIPAVPVCYSVLFLGCSLFNLCDSLSYLGS